MAAKKITYAEPKSYFNADMMKAAREFDKKTAASSKKTTKPAKKSK